MVLLLQSKMVNFVSQINGTTNEDFSKSLMQSSKDIDNERFLVDATRLIVTPKKNICGTISMPSNRPLVVF